MILHKKFLLITQSLFLAFIVNAQKPQSYHPGQIQQKLDKLTVLGSALYVAAHPDDENTRLIAYMANEEHYRTAYLSVTRGDGGQNLIGAEIRDDLGIIRSQELLAARNLDGGIQFFTRANDFGFSKNPEETLKIWDKKQVLSDYVRIIRTFKPDVIITRFNIEPGTTHGHHTASAMLAKEAFFLAGDPKAYPEQLKTLEVWQPKKLFWNTSWWFYQNTGRKMDTTGLVQVNIGTYNEQLGKSYTEIAAESRSMHKSQGFGATGSRGDEIEYLMQWEGENTGDLFGGIDTSWKRVKEAEKVSDLLMRAGEFYKSNDVQSTLSMLYQSREELIKLQDSFWKEVKLAEIDEVVRAIAGAYFEVVASDYSYVAGDSIKVEVEAITRKFVDFQLQEIVFEPWGQSINVQRQLIENQKFSSDYVFVIPKNKTNSSHYWINERASLGMYHVADESSIGKPENNPAFQARFVVKWQDQYIEYTRPIVYKRNDPVKGETYRPVEVSPVVMINVSSNVLVFGDNSAKSIEAKVIAGKAGVSGKVALQVPNGWKITPEFHEVSLALKNEEQLVSFSVIPPKTAQVGDLTASFTGNDGSVSNRGRVRIEYDHIPVQTYFPISKVKLVRLDLQKAGENIGYIAGAGDAIPESLRQIGYRVTLLEKDDVILSNLKKFDGVIVGVRAFNTLPWLAFKNNELFQYTFEGGTVIVQYNTSNQLVTKTLAPYEITLSRDRVTDENSEVQLLDKKHSLLNYPNKISELDFENWVQERGLYFPSKWDPAFSPVISTGDPDEKSAEGGLLVAQYGQGYYIYTGYSWFRQLPAGVPGSYRLFANMIGMGKSNGKIK